MPAKNNEQKARAPSINLTLKRSKLYDGVDLSTPVEIKRINNLLLSHFRKPMKGTKDKIAIRVGLLATYKYAIKQSKKARDDPKSGPKFADLNILRDIRVEYNQMLKKEIDKIQEAINAGKGKEKIAKMVWQARIEVGKSQKAKTPKFYRKLIYERNKRIYGKENEFGPRFSTLMDIHIKKIKKVKGKSYGPSNEEVYDSIIKSGPAATNVFLNKILAIPNVEFKLLNMP